ncbi:MAG: radical SAM protein [Chloroflexota bacterium]
MKSLPFSLHPQTVYLEILYSCNLSCEYCYIGKDSNHKSPTIGSKESIFKILQKLKEEGTQEIVLLGGEPTIHPQFQEICEKIAELKFTSKGIVTNGTLLSSELVRTLKRCDFWVDISFRSGNQAIFDKITAKNGSFEKCISAAKLCSDEGIHLGIEYDCSRYNYNSLYETILMLKDYGIILNQIQLHRILPEGDALESQQSLILSLQEWEEVFSQAQKIKQDLNIPIAFEDGFPYCLVDRKYWDLLVPCACGYTLITINPLGDVRYCACYKADLGNIFTTPLSEIWEASLRDYRMIENHPLPCQECLLVETCRSGCSVSGLNRGSNKDFFSEQFRSIKDLEDYSIPDLKLIIGQKIVSQNAKNISDKEQI